MRLLVSLLTALLAPALASGQPTLQPLTQKLQSLADAHEGKVAIGMKHLVTGESFFYHADDVLPTASLIKLPILIEAYLQACEKKIKLTDPVPLKNSDKVPGSGILTDHFSEGAILPFRDALTLMIVYSDNTATNLVLDRVGIRQVNERMRAWGLPETRINAKVFRGSTTSVDPARTKKYGLGSTTAREMIRLLEEIMLGTTVRPAAKQAVLAMLKKCDDREKFPHLLPANLEIAHKTGSVSDARTDAGILYLESGPVLLCVLTAENKDRTWRQENAGNVLCAQVARAVFDHYAKPPARPSRR